MAKLNLKMKNDEEKRQLDFHKPVEEQEEDPNDDINTGELKDSILEANELNSKQKEAILLKNEEIERLQEALAKEKETHQ